MKEKIQGGIDRVHYFIRRPRTRSEGLRNISQELKAVARDIALSGAANNIEITVENGTQFLPGEILWIHAGRVHIRLQQEECAAFIEYGPGLHDRISFKKDRKGHRHTEFATTFAGFPFKTRLKPQHKASKGFVAEIEGSLDKIFPFLDNHLPTAHRDATPTVLQRMLFISKRRA